MSHSISRVDEKVINPIGPLIAGNKRFIKDEKFAKERDRTAESQTPTYIIISCSDSRVSVPLIFDMPYLGKIFEVKTAGQNLASSDLESIKYAIDHLDEKVEAVIVLGHTKCGAVEATVKSLKDNKEGHDIRRDFPTIVRNILPAVLRVLKRTGKKIKFDKLVKKSVYQNAIDGAETVRFLLDGRSPVIPAVYNIKTGKVVFLSEEHGYFNKQC